MKKILFCVIFSLLSASVLAQGNYVMSDPGRDPSEIVLPSNYANQNKWPLLVVIHALQVDAAFERFYFGLDERIDSKGFVMLLPGSTYDTLGTRFWNANDYCCNHFNLPVNDLDYIRNLIIDTKNNYKIDPRRIYLLGHSNGAMMAQRLMCEDADLFAGVVSLAGAGTRTKSQCRLESPVSFLEIHALADDTVAYDGPSPEFLDLFRSTHGGQLYPYTADLSKLEYASSPDNVKYIAGQSGCKKNSLEELPRRKYILSATAQDTLPTRYKKCKKGVEVELWTLEEGGHVSFMNDAFKDDVLDFLLSKKKRY